MTAFDLPAELKHTLEQQLEGVSRNNAAVHAARISKTYREGGTSAGITTREEALAYAVARMPATYAAVSAALNAYLEVAADFAPASLLDVGAGPGTAAWACVTALPSLKAFALIDANPALRALACELASEHARLAGMTYQLGAARALLAQSEPADLVVASYLIGEMNDAEQASVSDALWAKTRHTLLAVEPGTPAGYRRILALRDRLIGVGAHVAAPCPHDRACPLTPPDWCHFSQRLARSRAHLQVKSAQLSFEDEKFIYLALTRSRPMTRFSRVLAPPLIGKIATEAKLCTDHGLDVMVASRRDKATYRTLRKARWGDALLKTGDDSTE